MSKFPLDDIMRQIEKPAKFLRDGPAEEVESPPVEVEPDAVCETFMVGTLRIYCYASEARGLEIVFDDYEVDQIIENLGPSQREQWRAGRDRAIQKLREKVGHPVAIFVDDDKADGAADWDT